MKTHRLLICALVCGSSPNTSALASDIGQKDFLRLSEPAYSDGLWKIEVHVINDEPLLGLDIPLRFGLPDDPVELAKVEFTDRVGNWDVKHAVIDNKEKTVIIGLVSEVGSARADAGLSLANVGNTIIADLLFIAPESYKIVTAPFTTENPGHALMFYYNQMENGKPEVMEVTPLLESNVGFKSALAVPLQYSLSQNFPNPFNPSTSFALSLPEASDFSLRIFNIAGQLVKSFAGHLEAGVHNIMWDGRNDQGSSVASGVYFYKAEANGFVEIRRMMLLK